MPRSLHPRQALADMLSRSIGLAKAVALVDDAAVQLGVGPYLNREDALRLLEHMAQHPGIVGITARFAKSRVHLVWGAQGES